MTRYRIQLLTEMAETEFEIELADSEYALLKRVADAAYAASIEDWQPYMKVERL